MSISLVGSLGELSTCERLSPVSDRRGGVLVLLEERKFLLRNYLLFDRQAIGVPWVVKSHHLD